jgi:hypothetical protein
MKWILCIALLIALVPAATWGDSKDEPLASFKRLGQSGLTFLKIGQGARPVGMGDAYTAISDDINAIFWNPAGLTQIEKTAYVFSYTSWLVNSRIYSGAFAYKGLGGVWGFSAVSAKPEDFEETTILQPQGTGKMVKTGDVALGLAFARQMTDKFSWAMNVRWAQETLHNNKVSFLILDVGTYLHTGFKTSRIAATLKNFGKDGKVYNNTFQMPLYFNVGLAMEAFGKREEKNYLTISAESAYAVDYGQRVHVGAELWMVNLLALRAGYKFNYDSESYTLGAGLRWKMGGKGRALTADFAYSGLRSDAGQFFDAPLRFSVGGSF